MAFARYYFKRLPLATPPAPNDIKLRAPTPWTWAMIRGANASGGQLTSISLAGSSDLITLTVVVAAGQETLSNSEYELIVGDPGTSPSDPTLKAAAQDAVKGAGIQVSAAKGFAVWGVTFTLDPPPPPFNWGFGATVGV